MCFNWSMVDISEYVMLCQQRKCILISIPMLRLIHQYKATFVYRMIAGINDF